MVGLIRLGGWGGILDRWEVKVILFVFAFLAKGEGSK